MASDEAGQSHERTNDSSGEHLLDLLAQSMSLTVFFLTRTPKDFASEFHKFKVPFGNKLIGTVAYDFSESFVYGDNNLSSLLFVELSGISNRRVKFRFPIECLVKFQNLAKIFLVIL